MGATLLGAVGAVGAAAALSARFNWWRPLVSGIPALMYHKIGVPPRGSTLKKLWVIPSDFEMQLAFLRENGFTPLTFTELSDGEEGRTPLPEKPVLITFDDGYADNYENAFPLLRSAGMKSNIFIVYETIGRHNAWHDPAAEPWQRMLTHDQIRSLRDSGLVEFGSHTMRHRCLTEISIDDACWEITESKKRLESLLERPVTAFAYPYGAGAYDPAIRSLVRESGYRYDFGIKQGISRLPWDPASGPLQRLLIRGDDTRLDFRLNMTRGRARL